MRLLELFDQKNRWFLIGIPILVLFIYGPAIWFKPTLLYDDRDLLTPLTQVSSLADYAEKLRKNQIMDLQPVRDFSFWLELRLEEATGVRNSQAVNVALWLLLLLCFWKILQLRIGDSSWSRAALLLLAVHPVATSTVAWTSARKHLLAGLLILAATWLSLKWLKAPGRALASGVILLFTLSLASQPIHLLWPAWLAFLIFSEGPKTGRKSLYLLPALLSLLSVATAYVNYRYYTGDLFQQFSPDSPPKINPESWQNLYHRFLVLGRYAFQILLPLKPVGVPYGLHQTVSFIGWLVIAITAAISRRQQCKVGILGFALALVPVTLMTTRLTHHAGADTYIFLSLAGAAWFFAEKLRRRAFTRTAALTIVSLTFVLSWLSWIQSRRWTSDDEIYRQAYESERTLFATTGHIKLLLNRQLLNEASLTLEDLVSRDPENREIPMLKGRLFFLTDLPAPEKKELFNQNEMSSPWYQYYFAAFEATQGLFSEANQRLSKSWEADPGEFRKAFLGNRGVVLGNWLKFCAQSLPPACETAELAEKNWPDSL